MKILKKIAIVIIGLIVLYVILGLIGPSGYKVSRSITINSPAEIIYKHTTIYKNWNAWSPWAKMDTNAIYTLENDNQQVGSSMKWEGNPENVGVGIMTTEALVENKSFNYIIEFISPWQMISHGGFTYNQNGDSTVVEWFDEGEFEFMARPMMLFIDLDAQIGPEFEKGLNDLKVICEKEAMKKKSPKLEIVEEMVESKAILFISESSSLISEEISGKIGTAYGEIMALISVAKLEMASAPITITKSYSKEEMTTEFDAAITVVNIPEDLTLDGRIQKGQTYAGKVLKTIHTGSYNNLHDTYTAILDYIKDNGDEINGNSWEEYITDPTEVAEEELKTFIYFPIK